MVHEARTTAGRSQLVTIRARVRALSPVTSVLQNIVRVTETILSQTSIRLIGRFCVQSFGFYDASSHDSRASTLQMLINHDFMTAYSVNTAYYPRLIFSTTQATFVIYSYHDSKYCQRQQFSSW